MPGEIGGGGGGRAFGGALDSGASVSFRVSIRNDGCTGVNGGGVGLSEDSRCLWRLEVRGGCCWNGGGGATRSSCI